MNTLPATVCVVPIAWRFVDILDNCIDDDIKKHRKHWHLPFDTKAERKIVGDLIDSQYLIWIQYPRRAKFGKPSQCGILKLTRICPMYGVSSKVGDIFATSNEPWAVVARQLILSRRHQ